jgi:hypothetical protein
MKEGVMKVLKEGKWHVPWTMEVDCGTCEARLLVEEEDLKTRLYCATGFVCKCSICGKDIHLAEKDIALRVREEVEKKHPRRYSSGSAWD